MYGSGRDLKEVLIKEVLIKLLMRNCFLIMNLTNIVCIEGMFWMLSIKFKWLL